uniref:Uncharacterized protein n=1 Tax=Bracon brevicornis TaxID=1563983 RepID=A0A6V7JN04_9HYME
MRVTSGDVKRIIGASVFASVLGSFRVTSSAHWPGRHCQGVTGEWWNYWGIIESTHEKLVLNSGKMRCVLEFPYFKDNLFDFSIR